MNKVAKKIKWILEKGKSVYEDKIKIDKKIEEGNIQ